MSLLETAILRAKVLTPKDIEKAEKLAKLITAIKKSVGITSELTIRLVAITVIAIHFPEGIPATILEGTLLVDCFFKFIWFLKSELNGSQ